MDGLTPYLLPLGIAVTAALVQYWLARDGWRRLTLAVPLGLIAWGGWTLWPGQPQDGMRDLAEVAQVLVIQLPALVGAVLGRLFGQARRGEGPAG